MKRRMFVGPLLAVMVAIGSFALAPVPVVQAATIVSSVLPIAKIKSVTEGALYHFDWTDAQALNVSVRVSSGSMTVDGVAATGNWVNMKASGTDKVIGLSGEGLWTAFTNGAYHVVSWSAGTLVPGDFDGINLYTWPAGSMSMKLPSTTNGVWVSAIVHPSVTISGPSAVDLVHTNTWTATGAGGTGPYTYAWAYGPIGPFFTYPYAGATLSKKLTTGKYTIEARVTDSTGATAISDLVVSASSVVGAYQAHFARTGSLGQYMIVNVTDTNGDPVTISSTAGTTYGWYITGAYITLPADTEAAQLASDPYSWQWEMTYTVEVPIYAIMNPPFDFYLTTTIHLAVPNIDIQVTHHFGNANELYDVWSGPTGISLVPEIPPTESSTQPAWVQEVKQWGLNILSVLFVPSSTDFSTQVSQGWVVITSPVPTIVPQYTIPFPNPNHLLAPTGDSVNIDFSVISTWTYYSTVKALVQVCLYAILVFIVIGIVT